MQPFYRFECYTVHGLARYQHVFVKCNSKGNQFGAKPVNGICFHLDQMSKILFLRRILFQCIGHNARREFRLDKNPVKSIGGLFGGCNTMTNQWLTEPPKTEITKKTHTEQKYNQ